MIIEGRPSSGDGEEGGGVDGTHEERGGGSSINGNGGRGCRLAGGSNNDRVREIEVAGACITEVRTNALLMTGRLKAGSVMASMILVNTIFWLQ